RRERRSPGPGTRPRSLAPVLPNHADLACSGMPDGRGVASTALRSPEGEQSGCRTYVNSLISNRVRAVRGVTVRSGHELRGRAAALCGGLPRGTEGEVISGP